MKAQFWDKAVRELRKRRTLYVYLPQESFIDTWVNGGRFPIKPTSTWLAEERVREKTLDERLIYRASAPLEALSPAVQFAEGVQIRDFVIQGVKGLPDMWIKERSYEDRMAVCFSQHLSGYIASKFERAFSVAIDDMPGLKGALDKALGLKSEGSPIYYTLDHQRNRYLKSIADCWQAEYRLTWQLTDALRERQDDHGVVWVDLPAGFGRRVHVPANPCFSLDDDRARNTYLLDALEHFIPPPSTATRPRRR